VTDDILGSYILDSRASSEFGEEKAKDKLINLELSVDNAPNIIFATAADGATAGPGLEDGVMGRKGKLLRLASWIDLDSRVTVCPPLQ
jgi:DNA mismatch repair protein MSH5